MDAIDVIRELRKRGLSQQTIAARTGLSQGAISHIETGRRKNVFATTRDKLVDLYKEVCEESASAPAEQETT
jgi:transcriptional regulator with XRE-family HTH domain